MTIKINEKKKTQQPVAFKEWRKIHNKQEGDKKQEYKEICLPSSIRMFYHGGKISSLIHYTFKICHKRLQKSCKITCTKVLKNESYFLPKCFSISSTMYIWDTNPKYSHVFLNPLKYFKKNSKFQEHNNKNFSLYLYKFSLGFSPPPFYL